jgi:hypothetical protein
MNKLTFIQYNLLFIETDFNSVIQYNVFNEFKKRLHNYNFFQAKIK